MTNTSSDRDRPRWGNGGGGEKGGVGEKREHRGQRTKMGAEEGRKSRRTERGETGTNNEARSKFGSRKLNREGFLGYV